MSFTYLVVQSDGVELGLEARGHVRQRLPGAFRVAEGELDGGLCLFWYVCVFKCVCV